MCMCCSGFSVLLCLGRACTLVAPTLLAFARSIAASSQALKNAPDRQRFSPRHLRTPCTASRAGGLSPQKPSPDRGEAQANRTGLCQEANTRQGKVSRCCSRGRGGFFWPLAPQHASACEGCGGGRAMDTAEGVSLSACSEPYPGAAGAKRRRSQWSCSRGASAARTAQHLKNPE
jgi:hypothetical protein